MLLGLALSVSSVRNCRGKKERGFTIRSCTMLWGLILVLISGILLYPPPFRYYILTVMLTALPVLYYRLIVLRQLIRKAEQTGWADGAPTRSGGNPVEDPPRARAG